MTARDCAYCGASGVPLTKEEVFRKFLERQPPTYTKHLSRAFPNAVLPQSRAIKDVCEPCNSERLSQLDGFAAQLCRQLGLVKPGGTGSIDYDHHLLARWLWKVFYNSARVNREPLDQLRPLIPYILGKQPQPPAPQGLLAGIIRTDPCNEAQRRVLKSALLYPKCIRIGSVAVGHQPAITFAVWLGINSYLFTVLLWASITNRPQRRALSNLIARRDGLTVLAEGTRRKTIGEMRMGTQEYLARNSWSPDPVEPSG